MPFSGAPGIVYKIVFDFSLYLTYIILMYEIDWKPKAIKQLLKIGDKSDRQSIRDAVGQLSGFPDCSGIKRLVNHSNEYRLRVGRYRVLFDVHSEIRIISIEEVKKRDERTY